MQAQHDCVSINTVNDIIITLSMSYDDVIHYSLFIGTLKIVRHYIIHSCKEY